MPRPMRTGVAFLLFCVALPDAHAAREKPAYSGVRLGQTQAEVRYMLGYPPNVIGPTPMADRFGGYPVYSTDGSDPKNAIPVGKKIEDFLDWSYQRMESRIDIHFSLHDVRVDEISCYSGAYKECAPLYGIVVGQTEDSIISDLGKPSSERLVNNAKELEYDDLGLKVTLTLGRAYIITLHN